MLNISFISPSRRRAFIRPHSFNPVCPVLFGQLICAIQESAYYDNYRYGSDDDARYADRTTFDGLTEQFYYAVSRRPQVNHDYAEYPEYSAQNHDTDRDRHE
jgi:hypothetical protein